MQIYNSVFHYECENCGDSVDLVPPSSIGFGVMIATLVLGFWWYVFFHSSVYITTLSMVLYGFAVAVVVWVWVPEMLKYWLYPVVKGAAPAPPVEIEQHGHAFGRLILWTERLGFFAGLLGPIVIVVVVLGSALILGFINELYFQ